MSESVEQAATVEGWKARAEREAAAIIAEAGHPHITNYRTVQTLVAAGWLQGASFGAHDALAHIEQAFGLTKASL